MNAKHRWGHLAMTAACLAISGSVVADGNWPSAGQDLSNSRHQSNEKRISPSTVGSLKPLWSLVTSGEVTANPALDEQHLYFPDNAGFLYKVDRKTGAVVWKNAISLYTGIAGDFARATPVIVGNLLILGNQSGKFVPAPPFFQPPPEPAQVFAVNKHSGAPVWATQVDPTQFSFVTHSAIVANDTVYVGIASNEELFAAFVPKAGWKWNFRGSVVALDVHTGAKKWQTYTVPEGYYGGAIWGSTGAVDIKRKQVYMATGNNYWLPESVLTCLQNGGSPASCMSPQNYFDSVIALDMDTGAVKWVGRGVPYDAWNVGCGLSVPGFVLPPNDNCPNPQGPDWDFAQGPILMSEPGKSRALVGAGQKSGVFWAFDADDGKLIWSTQAGPPGLTGGLQWGSAYDGDRIYVAISNSGPTGSAQAPLDWVLKDGTVTKAGGWAALERDSGAILWTTKDPDDSRAEAAVSVANGVVFGCNLNFAKGTMRALDAKSGKILWSFDSGISCNAGPSIADGVVYWGTGTFQGLPGVKKMFAFGL